MPKQLAPLDTQATNKYPRQEILELHTGDKLHLINT